MKPHYQAVKRLIKKHVELGDFTGEMELRGVTMEILSNINLFKIALEVIGFPPDISGVDGHGISTPSFDRHKWDNTAYCLEEKDIEPFIEQLYADYESYLLSKA